MNPQIFRNTNLLKTFKNPVITVGTFDGVHCGHKKIIEKLIESSKQINGESILITFEPHPRTVVDKTFTKFKLLNTTSEKIELLSDCNIDNIIIIPFTKEFSQTSYTDFIEDFIIKKIGAKKIIIGYDHKIGKNREGSFENILNITRKHNVEIIKVEVHEQNDVSISSTKIRKALSEGNIELANSYLGYNYLISGIVIKNNQIGRIIGYPTANIEIDNKNKLLPSNGVYAVKILYNNSFYEGMLNIGIKPTINDNKKTIEVNIFNFEKDIYGEYLKISFVKKIRNEIKFENLQQLKNQLNEDEIIIKNIFENAD